MECCSRWAVRVPVVDGTDDGLSMTAEADDGLSMTAEADTPLADSRSLIS